MSTTPQGQESRPVAGAEVDAATMRFLEWHEAMAHSIPGREVRDLGDAVLLHDPVDRDPFWNRLSAMRLPVDATDFDRRLEELLRLFDRLDRSPHAWLPPAHQIPVDLAGRLRKRGFRDVPGGLVMRLVDRGPVRGVFDALPGVTLERHRRPPRHDRPRLADEAAALLVAAFRVDPFARFRLARDLDEAFASDELHVYIARVGGTAVAVAKRLAFDGASYLSSIGTRPGWQGRGLGTLVTAACIRDSVAAGERYIYLGVREENVRARSLYERLGFARIGDTAHDLLLE